ncbi:cytochrome P450 11B1, mitochondrial-like [Gracilinanus agilis]|uniref:cytochrome P450 11B1, mitochondrial-like n=1 Tax=Gracilinanus agilis TaxID=191870 RepID=UPI001CFF4C07|nr:cytochrome P450 11B1, mitochondrial-like [Gracilinanus agilis]
MKRGIELGPQLLRALIWRPGGCRRLVTRALQETLTDSEPLSGSVRSFEDIPQSQGNPWFKMLKMWKENGLQNFHLDSQKKFQQLGPIYREKVGTFSTVNVHLPQDAEKVLKAEGPLPQRFETKPWLVHRQTRNRKRGIFLLNGKEWLNDRLKLNQDVLSPSGADHFIPLLNTICQDFVQHLDMRIRRNVRQSFTFNLRPYIFQFTLEASVYALYGERLGLLKSSPNPDALQFIQAINAMISSTPLLLYTPVALSRLINPKMWEKHFEAWDYIFKFADKCIQKIYQEMCLNGSPQYSGIMAELMAKADLSLEAIKANMLELTAGSLETTSFPMMITLFELARNKELQNALRKESLEIETHLEENPAKLIKELPLLRAAIKETLRLYPVGLIIQRYLNRDTILQNYRVPAGTLVQIILYSMGRSPEVFSQPDCYDPSRWLVPNTDQVNNQVSNFRFLAFGFGIRQCIGRRLAEAEMILFLHHVLKNFQVETLCKDDLNLCFRFVLHPKSFPLFTFSVLN